MSETAPSLMQLAHDAEGHLSYISPTTVSMGVRRIEVTKGSRVPAERLEGRLSHYRGGDNHARRCAESRLTID